MTPLDGQEREALTAHIAQRVREARAGKDWSQEQLATACGWTQAAVSLYEAGHRRTGIYELCVLAAKVERPLAFFLDDLPAEAALTVREEPEQPVSESCALTCYRDTDGVIAHSPECPGVHLHPAKPSPQDVLWRTVVERDELREALALAREDTERPEAHPEASFATAEGAMNRARADIAVVVAFLGNYGVSLDEKAARKVRDWVTHIERLCAPVLPKRGPSEPFKRASEGDGAITAHLDVVVQPSRVDELRAEGEQIWLIHHAALPPQWSDTDFVEYALKGRLNVRDTERPDRRLADPISGEEIAQGRGEFRIADSPAEERAGERLKHERGSIRAAFDGLGLGWDYEDVWDYCNGSVSFRTLPRDRRGIVAGMLMGFAIIVAERVRDTEQEPER